MRRALFIASIGASALLAPPTLFGQTERPDFSGKWVLDTAKSEQGPLTPQTMSYSVQQKGSQITADRTITTPNGASTAHLVFGIDGKQWKNEWEQVGMKVIGLSTLSWEGTTLVIKTLISADGQEVQQMDRWTLGSDGKTVIVQRSIETGGQSLTARMVMNKAP